MRRSVILNIAPAMTVRSVHFTFEHLKIVRNQDYRIHVARRGEVTILVALS